MPFFSISQMEADAAAVADSYGIFSSDPARPRGNGDARDAFRHTYVSAQLKDYFSTIYPDQQATGAAYLAGMIVEIVNTNNYDPTLFGDYNQDLWNDQVGSSYNPASGMTPAEYAKYALDNDMLITSDDVANQGGNVAEFSLFLEQAGVTVQSLKEIAPGIVDAIGDLFSLHSANAAEIADNLDGTVTGDVYVLSDPSEGKAEISVVANDATIEVGSQTYGVGDVLESVEYAAISVAEFIHDQASDAVEWFTESTGMQADVAEWLGANIQDLVDGTLDVGDAFIDLAVFLGQRYLSGQLQPILNVDDANAVLTEVFGALGIEGADAVGLANSLNVAIANMAIDFALNSNGWDSTDYLNAGITVTTAAVASHYARTSWFSTTIDGVVVVDAAQANATVAAITAAVTGLLNSGDFDTGDWLLLGTNVGIAYGAAYTGTAVAGLFSNAFLSAGSGTIVGAAVGIIGGKIIGGLFGGKEFGPGEFESAKDVLNSQYQLQEIDDGEGGTVLALVAVDAQGVTVDAISHVVSTLVGNVGQDVLIGNDQDNTIMGGAGSDYIEGREGDDSIVAEAANDNWPMGEMRELG